MVSIMASAMLYTIIQLSTPPEFGKGFVMYMYSFKIKQKVAVYIYITSSKFKNTQGR